MVRISARKKKHRMRVDARATIGFDLLTYDHLQSIAEAKNTPIAHIVREAVAVYLADQPKSITKSTKRGV